jgi:uncharacterized protein YndB with AHSA1/START domain
MATSTRVINASPERVFLLLGDPRSLSYFVVGTKTIRRFDPHWPDLGSVVHHSVGAGPFTLHDSSEVVDVEPDRRLVLEARIRPLAVMKVEFDLLPHPEGTQLVVTETPISGPAALPVIGRVVDAMVALRNKEMGRRLAVLIDARERQRTTTEHRA